MLPTELPDYRQPGFKLWKIRVRRLRYILSFHKIPVEHERFRIRTFKKRQCVDLLKAWLPENEKEARKQWPNTERTALEVEDHMTGEMTDLGSTSTAAKRRSVAEWKERIIAGGRI